ncbi:MAG TPA: hypothetical protein QF665_01470 [Alphaproteobacteria bacterium]|nr:hypothetical protein [Alphaproteobacteria bacterium]
MTDDLQPTDAEQKLIAAAAKGELCSLGDAEGSPTDESFGADWGEDRIICAEFIYALCVEGRWPAHAKGVHLVGAKIIGTLDFESAELRCPLYLVKCLVEQTPVFRDEKNRLSTLRGAASPAFPGTGWNRTPTFRLTAVCCGMVRCGFSGQR